MKCRSLSQLTFWVSLLGLVASACATHGTSLIPRRIQGRSQLGAFISPYAYEAFLRGELARNDEHWAEAAAHYRRARTGPADDPLLVARLADVLDQAGEHTRAIQLIEAEETRFPNREIIWTTRGQIAERHNDVTEALRCYAVAAAAAPEHARPILAAVQLLETQQRSSEAMELLQGFVMNQASSSDASHALLALAIRQNDPAAATTALRRLREQSSPQHEEIRAAAEMALAENRPGIAAQLFRSVPLRPEDRGARFRALFDSGDVNGAEGLLHQWNPQGAQDFADLAERYLELDQGDRALELAELALSLQTSTPIRLVYAQALLATGAWSRVAEVLQPVDTQDPHYDAVVICLADSLVAAGQSALASELLALRARTGTRPTIEAALERLRSLREVIQRSETISTNTEAATPSPSSPEPTSHDVP